MNHTVNEIAFLAIQKYNLEDSVSLKACEGKIRKIIKEKDFMFVDEHKSPRANRNAKAFSKEIVDKIIDKYLLDYAFKKTKENVVKKTLSTYKKASEIEEIVKKENGKYEDQQLALANQAREVQDPLGYYTGTEDKYITKDSKEFIKKRNQMMLDAIFSKFYIFKSDELLADLNYVQSFHDFYDGDATTSDLCLLEKIEQWENYVERKKDSI